MQAGPDVCTYIDGCGLDAATQRCGVCADAPGWSPDGFSSSVGCATLGQYTLTLGGVRYSFDCDFTARTGDGLTAAQACCECGGGGAAVSKVATGRAAG